MPDRILSSHPLYTGWLNLLMLKLRLATGEEIERPIVEHPSGAAVLPYDPERRVALVIREMRAPVLHAGAERFLEPIAGALDDDPPEECARREAMEEGGVRLATLEPVAHLWPTPATTTERVSFFLAPYAAADRVEEGGGLAEESEHIRVVERSLDALWAMVEEGSIRDMKLFVLLQALRIRRPELFGSSPAAK